MKEKLENTILVYAANVNGSSLDRCRGQYNNFYKTIKEVQADIVCGQEHNLNTTNTAVRSILNNTTAQHWKRNFINFASTPMTFENLYKPGGAFIMSVGNTTSQLRDRCQDNWGRWTSQNFQGRAERLVTVISAYQVITDTPAKGTTTAAAQQYSLLKQTNDTTSSPQVACRKTRSQTLYQLVSQISTRDITGWYQDKPSIIEWELWAHANRLWSNADGKVYQPLGRWLQCLPRQRIQNSEYKSRHHLFIRNQHGYIKCRALRNGKYAERSQQLVPLEIIPADANPVKVDMVNQSQWNITATTFLLHQPSRTFK